MTDDKKTITIIPISGDPPKEGQYGVCFDFQILSAIKTLQNGEYYTTEERFSSVETAQEWLNTHSLNDFFCFGSLLKL